MVNDKLLKYHLEKKADYSLQLTAILEATYYETSDMGFLNEALRRKQFAFL